MKTNISLQSLVAHFTLAFLCCFMLCAFFATAEPSFQEDLKAVGTYNFGDPDAPLRRVENTLYHSAAAGSKAAEALAGYEKDILEQLQGSCSEEGRRFLCRFLADIGSDAAVPLFATMVQDGDQFQLAVSTLEKFSSGKAAKALTDALPAADTAQRVVLLEALGRQGVATSATVLIPYLEASPEESQAAAWALAELGTSEGCQALSSLIVQLPLDKKILLAPAALNCVDALGAEDGAEVLELYRGTDFPAHIRIVALTGLIALEPENTDSLVIEGLKDQDARLAAASLALARAMDSDKITECLLALLDSTEDTLKASYLDVLRVRGGDAALAAAQRYADYDHLNTRLAAIKTVGTLGNASFVPFFLQRIVATTKDEQRTAREALIGMSDPETDATLLATAQSDGDIKLRVCAIEMLSERRSMNNAAALCSLALDAPAKVRNEAVHALRILGDPNMAGQMLFLTLIPGLDEIKSVLPQTIVALIQRGLASGSYDDNPAIRFYQELQELKDAQDLSAETLRNATCLIIESLALFGDDASFEIVRAALNNPETEIRKSALTAATRFQRTDSLEALQKRIGEESEDALRSLAFSGYLNVLKSATLLSGKVIDTHLQYAFEHATTPSEQREFLAAAAKAPSLKALQLTEQLLDQKETEGEAKRAALAVATALCGAWPEEAGFRLRALLATELPESMKVNAEKAMALLGAYGDYLMAWDYAGPYFEEGLMAHHLYEAVLPPQEDPESAAWKCLPLLIDAPLPTALEFDRLWGGEERVVFIRTRLQVEEAQELILELGSNDGCKVWLNGEELFAIADGRPLVPGENKIPLSLKAGDNRLMIAVYQQGGAWRATTRLATADGKPAQGVRALVD